MFRFGLLVGLAWLGLGWLMQGFHAGAVARAQPIVAQQPDRPARDTGNPAAEMIIPPGNDQTGYLGIVADDRADRGRGVRVLEVLRGAAAEQAGLKAGDLIVEIDGRPIRSMVDLAAVMQPSRPGETKRFVVERDGQRNEVRVVLGHRPPPTQRAFPHFGRIESPADGESQGAGETPVPRRGLLGVRAARISPAPLQRRSRVPVTQGALVTGIVKGSPADEAGIPLDAVIVGVNGQAVTNPDDLARLVNQAGAGAEIELEYFDRGRLVRRKVRLRSPDSSASATTQPGQTFENDNRLEELVRPRDARRLPPPVAGAAPREPLPPIPDGFSRQLDERLRHVEERLERLETLLERLLQQHDNKKQPAAPENVGSSEDLRPLDK